MNNRAFTTLLKIEILLIILLICCLALVGMWSSGRRKNAQPPPVAPTRARQQTSLSVERQPKRQVSRAVVVSRPSPERRKPLPPAAEPGIIGLASYYQDVFHGHQTASGERYDIAQLTAAHREFPFGTRVRVTNLRNGRQVTVRINDRGPEDRARLLDLSGEAARVLGVQDDGVAQVRLDIER